MAWLRVSIQDKFMMVNGDHILKIVEVPLRESGQRGCHLYTSENAYIEVDQSLHEMMIYLGFEERT